MAILVVGGHSRSVGKTSVVAGLIAALTEFRWTALKITQYGHGICSADGSECECATAGHSWAILEESDRSGKTDTSRFLAAGAQRALWVRTRQGELAAAMPAIRSKIAGADNVIIESNGIMRFLKPDLYLTVLDPETADFKSSAREFMDRVDAVILHQMRDDGPRWEGVSLKPVAGRRVFRITPPPYVTAELVGFVRTYLPASVS
jgi:molybdopterin-guanine dinucleotide biosynthesis protein